MGDIEPIVDLVKYLKPGQDIDWTDPTQRASAATALTELSTCEDTMALLANRIHPSQKGKNYRDTRADFDKQPDND